MHTNKISFSFLNHLFTYYAQDHVIAHIDERAGLVLALIAPIFAGLMLVRVLKQSLYYTLMLLRLGAFSIVGYSLFTLVIQQLTNQSWINHSMPFISINFSNHLTVEQSSVDGVFFCFFLCMLHLSMHMYMYNRKLFFANRLNYKHKIDIICTVLICVGVLYTIWILFERRPFTSFFTTAIIAGFVAIVTYQVVPELNQFLQQYSFILDYFLRQTKQVSIDVSFYVSLVGTILGVIVGLNFSNDIIEQGLSMVFGSVATTFGILCIYSSNFDGYPTTSSHNYNQSQTIGNDLSVLTMLVLTFGLLAIGVCRRYYVPSERRLRYIAKLHAKRVWKQLEEKQRKKYEKLLNNATINYKKQQKLNATNNNNLGELSPQQVSAAQDGDRKSKDRLNKKGANNSDSGKNSSRKQRKKAKKTIASNGAGNIANKAEKEEAECVRQNGHDSGYSAGSDEYQYNRRRKLSDSHEHED